jgi:hypothetical protein
MEKFSCKLCARRGRQYSTENVHAMVAHTCSDHADVMRSKGSYVCCFPNCFTSRSDLRAWKVHVLQCGLISAPRIDDEETAETDHPEVVLKCSACSMASADLTVIANHLTDHMKNCTSVRCPFVGCTRSFLRIKFFHRHLETAHSWKKGTCVLRPAARPAVPAALRDVSAQFFSEENAGWQDVSLFGSTVGPGFDANLEEEYESFEKVEQPVWFKNQVFNQEVDSVLLYISFNCMYSVPKSKILEVIECTTLYTERWLRAPGAVFLGDVVPCRDREVKDAVLDRVCQALPLKSLTSTHSRLGLWSDYRLMRFMQKKMQYVDPIDISELSPAALGLEKNDIPRGKGAQLYIVLLMTYFCIYTCVNLA